MPRPSSAPPGSWPTSPSGLPPAETTSRWGRVAALVAIALSVANWLGWVTGQEALTALVPGWPPMRPWTALWLLLLASAVLMMVSDRSGLRWAARALASLAGLTAAAVLAQYLLGHDSSIDNVWFGQAVASHAAENVDWSGRPPAAVAASVVLMSAAFLLWDIDRQWARRCLTGALAIPIAFLMVYLLSQLASAHRATALAGVAPMTIVALLLTGSAALLTDPEWLPRHPRNALRLVAIVLLALIGLGFAARGLEHLTHDARTAMAAAVALALLAGGTTAATLSRREGATARALEAEHSLLRTTFDAMFDPQLLLEPIRDPSGNIVDLVCRAANRAACRYFDRSEDELVGTLATQAVPDAAVRSVVINWLSSVLAAGHPIVVDDIPLSSSYLPGSRYYDLRATQTADGLYTVSIRDVTERHQQQARLEASEKEYRLLAENIGDVVTLVREGKVAWISPSVENVLGAPPAYWIGRAHDEIIPPDETERYEAARAVTRAGGVVKGRVRVRSLDGVRHWAHLYAKPYFDSDGKHDGSVSSLRLIDEEVAAEASAESAMRAAALANKRFRSSVEHSAVAMALFRGDGRLEEVNDAMCDLLGYSRPSLLRMTLREVTAPEYQLQSDGAVDDLRDGHCDSVRLTMQYIHCDGHTIWGDASLSPVPEGDNDAATLFLAQIVDITALTEANARNRTLAQHLQELTEKLTAELGGAASYMASIMPHSLTGRVNVSSCYLPSRELGGDCFDYAWVDDDHLSVYLIDVSGHGLRPALLAVSIQNLLRSGSLPQETLLSPERTLTALNNLFRMDRQSNLYFTAWYGIFQHSTRTLRYTSAGAPPALALTPGTGRAEAPIELATPCPPIGILADTPFEEHTFEVPEDCQLLIYSDGAFELDSEHPPMRLGEFTNLVSRLAASPRWSLDQLVHRLQDRTSTGSFEDDCSLILLNFA